MRRKIRLLFVLLIVCCSVMIANAAETSAETLIATDSTPHLYAANVTATKGETISYPICIEGNTGIAAIKLTFEIDGKDITPVIDENEGGKTLAFEKGEMLTSGSAYGSASEDGGQIVWFDVKNNKSSGTLFVVKLKVADNASTGSYSVKITYSPENTITQNETPVTFKTTNGTITVTASSGNSGNSGSSSSSGSSGSSSSSTSSGSSGGGAAGTATSGSDKQNVTTDSGDTAGKVDDGKDTADTAVQSAGDIKAALENVKIKLSSRLVKTKSKTAIKLTWKVNNVDDEELKFDGYDVRRSVKKSSGYGKKSFAQPKKTSYTNTKSLKKGKTYYYKVRAYKLVDGKKFYTGWSNKAWRTIK